MANLIQRVEYTLHGSVYICRHTLQRSEKGEVTQSSGIIYPYPAV